MTQPKVTPVVIDCDPGNDDAWAIIALLKGESKFNFKLRGITLVNGNTSVENASRNALLVLETLGRLDVPVFKGAASSLLIKPGYYPKFHGVDGFAGVYKDKPSMELVQRKHAVDVLKDLIDQNPKELAIVAVGPLTNIALLYKLHPGISSNIKSLHIMGGNRLAVGNISRCAEFNFWSDPEAAHIVLAESQCPIYICPWETCVEACKSTPNQEWRMKVLSSNGNSITKLMDPVDKKIEFNGNFLACDAYSTCCFIVPQMITSMELCHVTVELAGNHTRGKMVIDRKSELRNAFIIKAIDAEMFKNFLLWICGHDGSSPESFLMQHGTD